MSQLITFFAAALPGMPKAPAASDAGPELKPAVPMDVDPLGEKLPEFVDYLPQQLRPAWDTIAQYPALQGLIIAVLFFAIA